MSELVPVLVNVEVKPERLDEFLDVMKQDAEGSRTEPGCLRFDVMQDETNPCKFVFYEVPRARVESYHGGHRCVSLRACSKTS